MSEKVCVVVAWWNEEQILKFCSAWGFGTGVMGMPDWLVLQRDTRREGCAVTKNKGVAEAMRRGFDIVVVLDDDCLPCGKGHLSPPEGGGYHNGPWTLESLMAHHVEALKPQPVEMILPVTWPISRGTPYKERTVLLPVAASMGFWTEVGDYDAPSQLAFAQDARPHPGPLPRERGKLPLDGALPPMAFSRVQVVNQYFSLCGMNLAFRPKDWLPWCTFIDVPRFDDIWMGWLWQREAYRRGFCFNLNGPLVRHSRQSNVWQNLRDEAKHLEWNETGWRQIATHTDGSYEGLRKLLPV